MSDKKQISESDVRRIFERVYGLEVDPHNRNLKRLARNPLTPVTMGYGTRKGLAYELTRTEDSSMFGVTVLTLAGEKRPQFSGAFSTEEEARLHISDLGKPLTVS